MDYITTDLTYLITSEYQSLLVIKERKCQKHVFAVDCKSASRIPEFKHVSTHDVNLQTKNKS